MKLSKHFDRSEFACLCGCGFATIDYRLLEILTELREYFNTPVHINSGCRCYKYNEEVQKIHKKGYIYGTSKSKHMEGIAADIVVEGQSPHKIYNYLSNKYPNELGLGNARSFTHLDSREIKARWTY